ncbi:MAG TPA: pirin, partial [Nitrospina sp.]|nr:pirin [Nitrospina sp.]
MGREPTYAQYQHEDFPIENMDGHAVKTIIGHGAPVAIEAEAKMCDIQIDEEREYSGNLSFERTLAVMVVSGKGVLLEKNNGEENILGEKQFLIIHAH